MQNLIRNRSRNKMIAHCVSKLQSNTYRFFEWIWFQIFPHQAHNSNFSIFFLFVLQSDIFGSLNDQGLLSRASEALVAMDMKHPVSSAHQVFPPIKSDMMYSHPAISSAAAAASGTSISRSSNHVSLIILLFKEFLRIGQNTSSNHIF